MPHSYNRLGFGTMAADSPLLALYCQLVALELRLKDEAPNWPAGHDVPNLLRAGTYGAAVETLATELERRLVRIPCTARDGSTATVPASNFPAARYFRHAEDFADGGDPSLLDDVLDVVTDIADELEGGLVGVS